MDSEADDKYPNYLLYNLMVKNVSIMEAIDLKEKLEALYVVEEVTLQMKATVLFWIGVRKKFWRILIIRWPIFSFRHLMSTN